ncbi:unannotated protein [freshwater metagenome]|uniref:Unannotated protein n=1 Tax=freshwater metagenome TaxID=449393 RepID=A0A6J6A8M3_9ZZZZ
MFMQRSSFGRTIGQTDIVSATDHPHGSCKALLLVATPPLVDPNFDRTVVYMLEHNSDGAVGVVLNRPTDEESPEIVRAWQRHLAPPATMFQGGPVETDALIALARLKAPVDEAWSRVTDDFGSVDLMLDPDQVAEQVLALRVFRGYSGWGAGQLDGELAEGAWMVFPAERGDVFDPNPTGLWRAVVRRQGGKVAWLANAPDDLSAN